MALHWRSPQPSSPPLPSPLPRTTAEPPARDLAASLGSPSFTPGRRDVDAILDLFEEGQVAEAVVAQALGRVGTPAFARLKARLQEGQSRGTARAALVRLLARLTRAEEPAELAALVALTRDADPPAARNAIAGLGRLARPAGAALHAIEPALLALWDERPHAVDRRALAEALGKQGGAAALQRLRAAQAEADADPLLQQVLARAVLRLARTTERPPAAGPHDGPPLDATARLPQPLEVTLLCRAGLTTVVAAELRARRLLPADAAPRYHESERLGEPGRVTVRWAGSLGELLAVRTCTQLALALPTPPSVRGVGDDAIVAAVTAGLTAPGVLAALRALSRGPLRYRLHFADMGPRRALVLRIASALFDRCPELRNDPTDSPWELRIGGGHEPSAPLRLELLPRQLPDARFAYRTGDVPAASHPTLAAALARLCAAQPGDVVWDPFVGSGSELIEVALLARAASPTERPVISAQVPPVSTRPREKRAVGGDASPGMAGRTGTSPPERLRPVVCVGSDLSTAALATAAANADAAGVALTLRHADALAPPPPGLTHILTNPPMGRRVQRGTATELLARFAEHAAQVLPRRGQLTFITPQPQRTGPLLEAGGLRLHVAHAVDMNGFWARIEVWRKP